ncbi:MAG: prolyl-tRNA synthetase associated domain-containing protein [Ruminococcus callidus]
MCFFDRRVILNGNPKRQTRRRKRQTAKRDRRIQLTGTARHSFARADHGSLYHGSLRKYFCGTATPVCKNLFLCNRQKTNFYLLLMPADKPFRTKEITSQLGCARLSFASEDAMEQLLQLTPGSATIFGLMHDTENRVQLLVDRDLLEEATFGCHPCINTSTIRMQTGDVFDKLTTALHHPYTIVTLKGE